MDKNVNINEMITDERRIKIQDLVAKRQNMTVILENVHDPHNIGAVMRSCDAVGISEIFILYTDACYNHLHQKVGRNSSSGSQKWVDVHYFGDLDECFEVVRSRYDLVLGTHLGEDSKSLYDLDLTKSVAFMFGNEKSGITKEALQRLDGNYIIPQYGMVQSLNISVACAVSLFEASRQRAIRGMYHPEFDGNNPAHESKYDYYVNRHFEFVRSK